MREQSGPIDTYVGVKQIEFIYDIHYDIKYMCLCSYSQAIPLIFRARKMRRPPSPLPHEGNYNEVVMSINDNFRTLKRRLINMFYGCEKKSMNEKINK